MEETLVTAVREFQFALLWPSVNTKDAYEVINTACRNIQSESIILMKVFLSRR